MMEVEDMAGKRNVNVPDYGKIVIYPGNYDNGTRRRLYELMRRLGIPIIYERYG